MAYTKVSLDPSTWTAVSPSGATSVSVSLPKTIRRIGSGDAVALVVAASAPSAGASDVEIYLQNDRYQPLGALNQSLAAGEELYARWDGGAQDSASQYVIRL